MLLWKRPVR